jgi:hypothetical protein
MSFNEAHRLKGKLTRKEGDDCDKKRFMVGEKNNELRDFTEIVSAAATEGKESERVSDEEMCEIGEVTSNPTRMDTAESMELDEDGPCRKETRGPSTSNVIVDDIISKKVKKSCMDLSLLAHQNNEFLLLVSGTPISNDVYDAFDLLYYIDPCPKRLSVPTDQLETPSQMTMATVIK